MFIKQLEVDNFKSFANQVTIPFLKGFTTISGPNGSGKSNIIDSILFALGLSSSRTLRAEKLFHLISTHTKRNEAFVKVTFALEDEANSEFTVARRIKKTSSGFNSIYYYNDKICTLSQIHIELEKYNITPNSYNVMMQGDVTSITACSGTERRKIIDEIAGVADFDRRIEQAENELETVESRVERSILILNEVDVSLEQLKEEREQALKYKELKDEKSKLESQINVAKYFNIKKSLELVHENILEFEKNKKDERVKLEEILIDLKSKQESFKELSDLIKEKGETQQLEVKKQAEELKASIEIKNSSIIFADKNIQDNLKTIENAKNGILNLQKKIDDCKLKIETKLLDIKKVEEEKAEEKEILKQILEEVSGLNQSADEQLLKRSSLRKELEEAKDKELDIQKEKIPLETELVNLKKQLEVGKLNLEKLKSFDFEERKDKLVLEEEQLKKELEDFKQIQQNNLYELDKVKNEINDLTYTIRTASNKIAQMEGQKMAFEEANFGRAIDIILDSNLAGVHAPLAQLAQVDKEYSLALEIAMGARMKHIVVDDDFTARKAIEILKSSNAGRATFLPLNKIKRAPSSLRTPNDRGVIDFAINLIDFDDIYTDAFYLALGETLIVEDYVTAQKFIGKYKMVTLSGELFEKTGAITGGSSNNRSRIRFSQSQDDELNEYKSRLNTLESKLLNLESKKTDLENKQDKVRFEYSNLNNEYSKVKIELANILKTQEESKTNIENQTKQIEIIEPKIPEIEKRLDELEIKEFDLQNRILKLDEEISEIESKMSESELSKLKEKTESIELKIKKFDNQINIFNNDINDFNRDINFNIEVIKTKNEQIEKLLKDNEILKTDKEKFKIDIEGLKIQLEELNVKLEELSKNLSEYQVKRDNLDKEIRELLNKQALIENNQERINEQIESFKSRRRELEPQLNQIITQLEEEKYIISKLEVPKLSIDDINIGINRLTKKMESLEPVNMRSITSYEEVLLRKEELQNRIDTLSNERKQIYQRMSSYEKLKKDTFLETYNQVNNNFKEIFQALSDGEGTLILDNVENPFTGGLTIEAQPRDKKKQRLELMSGGEKSLTALAFVFAIQKYMPAPFYAFDEVDMHLDGINVEKLSEMIQKQSENTQFIVVSLRKPMIESANRTIGVTQKDKGITRVTGVKLRD